VVDDMAELRTLVRMALSLRLPDAEFREAADGAAALAAVEGWTPDAVILDVVFPGETGVEILAQLRPRLPEARIVMFSSADYGNVGPRSRELGADDFIEKSEGSPGLLRALGL
jgi:two-component system OmpR family response regulator